MAKAELLMPFILSWEGGFVDDPDDRGGATNKGVTIGTFRQFYGADATVEQLRAITDEQWLRIFRAGYWDPWHGDDIASQGVANIVVDWAWASGTATSIRLVQRIVGVVADGIVGKNTLAAVNGADAAGLFAAIRQRRLEFVEGIVRRDPRQRKFLRGWQNRINAIKFVP